MPRVLSYAEKTAQTRTKQLRSLLSELPDACADFIYGIADTTSELTRLAYAYDLRLFFTYVAALKNRPATEITYAEIQNLTVRDLENFQQYLSLYERDQSTHTNAASGKMRKMSTLRSFYDYMYKHNYIASNLAELIPLPKLHEKPIVHLEADEIVRLLDTADTGEALTDHQKFYHDQTRVRDVAILTLMLGTGIRVSECVGLDLSDINYAECAFRVTRKGGDQAILYFSAEVAKALQAYHSNRSMIQAVPGHENALFLSLQRKRITQRAVQNLTHKYARIATPLKNISPHKLRSSFGTQLYRESGDIYLVADVLGHADVNTTRRHYAAMSEQNRRRASQLVKLRED